METSWKQRVCSLRLALDEQRTSRDRVTNGPAPIAAPPVLHVRNACEATNGIEERGDDAQAQICRARHRSRRLRVSRSACRLQGSPFDACRCRRYEEGAEHG